MFNKATHLLIQRRENQWGSTPHRRIIAPWSKCLLLSQKCIWSRYDLHLWLLSLKTFSAMSLRAKFHLNFSTNYTQCRRQLWGTGHVPPPSTSKSESQLSKSCVVCEISWCRCQQLTALSISVGLLH